MLSIKNIVLIVILNLIFNGCGESSSNTASNIPLASEEDLVETEISDSYTKWASKDYNQTITIDNLEINTSYIPVKYLPPENSNFNTRSLRATTLPNKFDLRDINSNDNQDDTQITPIRDQGQCGVCWAFATYGALEGSYEINTFLDFSEDNLKHKHGFTYR